MKFLPIVRSDPGHRHSFEF